MAKLLGASFGTVLAARELTSNGLSFPHSSELPKPIVNWLRVKKTCVGLGFRVKGLGF